MRAPSTKFKVGDLIIFPQELRFDPENDYGIVVDITYGNSESLLLSYSLGTGTDGDCGRLGLCGRKLFIS